MVLRKRLCCGSLKVNIKCIVLHCIVSGFLTATFLFLMLLTVNNCSWLPKKYVSADILDYLKVQKNQHEELDSEQDGEANDKFSGKYNFKYIINEPKKCQKKNPFLILLIAVQAWQSEARQAIRQTWGNEDLVPGIQTVRLFLLGKDATSNIDVERALVNESGTYHDIIQQEYLDTYNNLTLKTLVGLRWVAMYCRQTPYVMKTDSDMFVNTEYLIKKLLIPDQPPRKNYFTGYLMRNFLPNRNTDSKWYMAPSLYPEERYPAFCSGTGYVFSGDLAEKIFNVSTSITYLHLEDVFVGVCLNKIGVSPVSPPKESDFNHWKVSYSPCYYNQIVTSHQFRPAELISTWESLQRNKHTCV